MAEIDYPTTLLHTHHLSRQIKHVHTQVKSVLESGALLDHRLEVVENAIDPSKFADLHQSMAILQQQNEGDSGHRDWVEEKIALLEKSLLEEKKQNSGLRRAFQATANENKSIKRSLKQALDENRSMNRKFDVLQSDLAKIMLLMENLQGGQNGEGAQALSLRIDSVASAQNSNQEQIGAVHQRMLLLEEENVQVKASVAELTANLQVLDMCAPMASRVRQTTPQHPVPSDALTIPPANLLRGRPRDKRKPKSTRANTAKLAPKSSRLSGIGAATRLEISNAEGPTQISKMVPDMRNDNPSKLKIIGSPHVIYSDHRREHRQLRSHSMETESD